VKPIVPKERRSALDVWAIPTIDLWNGNRKDASIEASLPIPDLG